MLGTEAARSRMQDNYYHISQALRLYRSLYFRPVEKEREQRQRHAPAEEEINCTFIIFRRINDSTMSRNPAKRLDSFPR